MRFKHYWRTTIVAALFIHFFVVLGVVLALPHLAMDPEPVTIDEMDVVDVPEDPGDDVAQDEAPTPPPTTPTPPAVPQPVPPTLEEAAPVDIPEMSPTIAAELDEAIAESTDSASAAPGQGSDNGKGRQGPPAPPNMHIGPEVVGGNTPDARGTDFRGIIGVFVVVGPDGKVLGAKVSTRNSGRPMLDRVAVNAAYRLQYVPAIDDQGQPMKAQRYIAFQFDGSGPHPFDDDENKRIRADKQMEAAKNAQR